MDQNQLSIRVNRAESGGADWTLVEAQGYWSAYDRFFQMDVMRRMARGKLAEVFGESALKKDIQTRAIGLDLAAMRNAEKIRKEYPDSYFLLQGFAAGVNRFLATVENARPDVLPLYRKLTHSSNYQPAPWEPEDSLSTAVSVSFFLSNALQEKLTFGTLMMKGFGISKMNSFIQFMDFRPFEDIFIMDQGKNPRGWEKAPAPLERDLNSHFEGIALNAGCEDKGFPFSGCFRNLAMGSNNWVVGPQYAGPGRAILSDDPHLPLTYPMTFDEFAVDSTPAKGTIKSKGYNLPTLPLVMIGMNNFIAWGFTNLAADVDDDYIEVMSQSGDEVWFKGKWVKVQKLTYSIPVRQADGSLKPAPMTLRLVPHHGPLFGEHFPELAPALVGVEKLIRAKNPGLKNVKAGVSYRWTGLEGTAELAAIVGINRAHNFDEFKNAARAFDSGSQNIVYMDLKGNIGYFGHGKFPLRPYANKKWPPYLPAIGTGEMEWAGYRAEVPEIYNPPGGRIITANNDPYGHTGGKNLYDFRDYFGYGFSTGMRAKRISDLLDVLKGTLQREGRTATPQDMVRIQTDHKDLAAQRFVALLEKASSKLKLDARGTDLLTRLEGWDGEMNASLREPVLAATFFSELKAEFLDTTAKDLAPDPKDQKMGLLISDFTKKWLPQEERATEEELKELFGRLNDAGGQTIVAKIVYHHLSKIIYHRMEKALSGERGERRAAGGRYFGAVRESSGGQPCGTRRQALGTGEYFEIC